MGIYPYSSMNLLKNITKDTVRAIKESRLASKLSYTPDKNRQEIEEELRQLKNLRPQKKTTNPNSSKNE